MKTSLLEHPHREPRQHFPTRAAANDLVDFPQLTLPENTISVFSSLVLGVSLQV